MPAIVRGAGSVSRQRRWRMVVLPLRMWRWKRGRLRVGAGRQWELGDRRPSASTLRSNASMGSVLSDWPWARVNARTRREKSPRAVHIRLVVVSRLHFAPRAGRMRASSNSVVVRREEGAWLLYMGGATAIPACPGAAALLASGNFCSLNAGWRPPRNAVVGDGGR